MRQKLTKIIDKSMAKTIDAPRNYIGASSIGGDCLRKIWYQFKGEKGEEFTPRTKRILEVGKALERLILHWLVDAGVKIEFPTPYNKELWYCDPDNEFFQGHLDAFMPNFAAVLEIKTAKDSSFNKLVKEGVQKWSKEYYAQIQSYMGMSGFHSAYILVLNKDNSELYDELINFDAEFYETLRQKAKMIYDATVAPPRVHGSPLWWQCKLCKYNKVCHK
ncbi:MAG TPA: YqaJ viral recombinase family protein [Rummeliibacillus sp.]|nr:YqaJ viral recombinase family protein [Rummeliibacillus sp.]